MEKCIFFLFVKVFFLFYVLYKACFYNKNVQIVEHVSIIIMEEFVLIQKWLSHFFCDSVYAVWDPFTSPSPPYPPLNNFPIEYILPFHTHHQMFTSLFKWGYPPSCVITPLTPHIWIMKSLFPNCFPSFPTSDWWPPLNWPPSLW